MLPFNAVHEYVAENPAGICVEVNTVLSPPDAMIKNSNLIPAVLALVVYMSLVTDANDVSHPAVTLLISALVAPSRTRKKNIAEAIVLFARR